MSKTTEKWVSPIAIDLGAKNTGVYYAHYKASSGLGDIQKDGKVYQLEKDKYTLLMASRTATRHQRRGFDRRQLVKRLFKLIWEKHFGLGWDKNVQQTVSFLLNRRGFTFLTEQYDKEILSQFPKEAYEKAYKKLPDELKNGVEENQENGGYDFDSILQAWSREGQEKLEPVFDFLNKEPKRIAQRQVFINRTKQLKDYCKDPQKHQISRDLTHISKWILEEWKKIGVEGLPDNIDNQTDLINILKEKDQKKINIILESLPDTSQEDQELKSSIWNFKSENFNLDKAKFTVSKSVSESQNDETEKPYIKTHLNHLAFAIYKNLEELKSGSRHRSKYFEEIKNVLEKEYKAKNENGNKTGDHGYLMTFCQNLKSDKFKELNVEKLTFLIGHLSNLELKTLRKYFNDDLEPKPCKKKKCCKDKKHKDGDYWCECRLSWLFDRWILKQWRVNLEKDKNKATDKPEDYDELKKKWKKHYRDESKEERSQSNTVIDFWLKTCPLLTIPPYQDNNNRRPPRCQSLILNPKFLDQKYPDWQDWLQMLKGIPDVEKHFDHFEKALKEEIKTGKGNSYFKDNLTGKLEKDSGSLTDKNLEARILQFIFDRVKDTDPLNLNEIYSHVKKIKQDQHDGKVLNESIRTNFENAIANSKLSDDLKIKPKFDTDDLFEQNSFLHLICKYYKLRQKAKDGRLFIHPEYRYIKGKGRGYEDTGRFDDRKCLLTYCNHKPRQKHYQILYDIAGVLQVSPDNLREVIKSSSRDTDEKYLIKWLESEKFKGLKTYTEKASKAQKDYRGELKSLMDKAIKDKNSDLYKLHKKIDELSRKIGEALFGVVDDIDEDAIKSFEQKVKKFNSVFSFAQINNIAFKERNGNAKTCSVCSLDNAHRMIQVPSSTDKTNTSAKAQRLPAIETRLIDGAVMRMARIVGSAISKDKWKTIEKKLERGHKVHIPIITESNRFEFEPSLKNLKGKKNKKDNKETSDIVFKNKKDRIKEEGKGFCPYCEKILEKSNGDLDHIIPRSSQWGTLNDEANLIFTCSSCNRDKKKDNTEYSLQNLELKYKQNLFEGKTNQQIEDWIIQTIDSGKVEDFKFGRYRSFINLTPDQQKAFRHALFLVNHPIRDKVIQSIQHRNKTFVNGTQRYFAQVLANKLYKKAKAIKKQYLLSFDYFGVEAQSNSRGDGIYDLRKRYEEVDSKIKKYSKNGKRQEPYSHLIDAQLAFAIIADAHKKEGSLKLKIDDSVYLWPFNEKTGEISNKNLFDEIKIPPEDMNQKELKKRKPYDIETHHRQLLNKGKKKQIRISYKIHRDNSIGERFFPLLEFKEGTIKKGFHPNNSAQYKKENFEFLKIFLQQSEKSKNKNYQVWTINKKQAQEFLIGIGVRGANNDDKQKAKLLDDLSYQTSKVKIQKALTPKDQNKEPATVSEAIGSWNQCVEKIKEEKFIKDKIIMPFYNDWQKLKSEFDEADPNQNLQEFLKNCSLFQNEITHDHKKVRKVYSLPMLTGIGNIRLRRKTWDNNTIIQTVGEESIAKYGYDGKDRPHAILSKNSVPKKHYSGLPKNWPVQSRKWITIPIEGIKNNEVPIQSAKIINQDANRCTAKITIDFTTASTLSIPDKEHWKGKIVCHETDEELQKAKTKDKKNNYHCLNNNYKWFSDPFKLPMENNKSREVKIKRGSDHVFITFTISKNTQIKQWMRGGE